MNGKNGQRTTGKIGNRFLRTRLLAPLGAVAVLAILLIGAGSAGAQTSPPAEPHATLITIPLIDAIAANSTMVFTQGVANCSQIWGVTPAGNASVYATVPVANSSCDEGELALAPINICVGPSSPSNVSELPRETEWSPGGGNWGHGGHHGCNSEQQNRCHNDNSNAVNLFDVVAGDLFEISQGGTNVTEVANFTVPSGTAENLGVTYDQVGFFNHDLIVTSSSSGQVWLVNQTGNVTLLTELHTYIGGPAVAPMWFGSYGGDIVLAEKKLGKVAAITPSGNVSDVTNWSKANAVAFPARPGNSSDYGYGGGCGGGWGGGCTFGANRDVLFVANYSSGALEAFPASDLQNFSGQGFVAGGLNQGIASFTSTGITTLFQSQTQRLSDIAFITCFPSHGGGGRGGHW